MLEAPRKLTNGSQRLWAEASQKAFHMLLGRSLKLPENFGDGSQKPSGRPPGRPFWAAI